MECLESGLVRLRETGAQVRYLNKRPELDDFAGLAR